MTKQRSHTGTGALSTEHTGVLRPPAVSEGETTAVRLPCRRPGRAEGNRCQWHCPKSLPFARREVDELDPLVAEPLNLFELLAPPERDASLMEGRQIGALGRPAHVRLRPPLRRHKAALTAPHGQAHTPARPPCSRAQLPPCAASTHRSLFYRHGILHVIPEYGGAVPTLEDHAVLIPALRLLQPVAQIPLEEDRGGVTSVFIRETHCPSHCSRRWAHSGSSSLSHPSSQEAGQLLFTY